MLCLPGNFGMCQQVTSEVDLRERHLGVLEGLTRLEAVQQHPADFANLSGSPDAKPQACRNTKRYVCLDPCS